MAVQVGQDVGRYHIVEALGQGGMATVYRAYDTRLEREVAIKFIRTDQITPASLGQALKRFEREAKSLAGLDHPNIIRIYDFGEYNGSPYLVMQYIGGGTLKQRIAGQPMLWQEAARLLAPVARALEYAHEEHIIHRDIKPSNILLTKKGVPMLSDFGIAKMLGVEETTQLTGTGVGVGTPEYMAPEQWQGKVVPQTDIYALGVVFYEMVTGHKPYTADTPAAVLIKQITESLPSPRSFVPDLPEEVERVLFKALAKEAGNRYASMAEIAAVLERLGTPTSPVTSPPAPLPLGEGSKLPSSISGGRVGDAGRPPSPAVVDEGTLSASIPPAISITPEKHAAPAQRVVQSPTGVQSPIAPQSPRQDQPSLTKEHLAAPSPAAQPSRRLAKVNTVWLWVGIGIVVVCLVGVVGAGIATQGFGLLKTQPSATQSIGQAATTPPAPGKTLQPTITGTAALGNTPRSTLTPTLAITVTLAPTPIPTLTHTATLAPVLAGTPLPLPLTAISPQNAGQVAVLARWGRGTVNKVLYSPDGKSLAVASSLGIDLYDAATLKEQRFIESSVSVNSIAFSPDGATLASGSDDVKLWRVSDGSLLSTLQDTGGVSSVAFSPGGKTLASGFGDGTVKLWRVSDGSLLSTLNGHTSWVSSVAFSPDGATLASGSGDATVKLWRVSDGSLLFTLMGHKSWVYSVAFSPDGATLASGSEDATVKLWRVSDGSLLSTLTGHTGKIISVAFSPDGATLASGSGDGTVNLWRVSDGSLLFTLQEHTNWVTSISFSPDGKTLASGLGDGTVKLWRVSDGSLLSTVKGYTSSVLSVAFSTDGVTLASGSWDYTVKLWRISDGSLLSTLQAVYGIQSVAFSTDGKTLASGSNDGMVELWQVSDGSLLFTLKGHTSSVFSVAFSPDGATLASGSDDGTVKLWRVSDGSLLSTLTGHTDDVNSVAFSPDGKTLASGSSDNTVKLWRVSDGSLLSTLTGHEGKAISVAFSPDGAILASGSGDSSVKLWRVSDGSLLSTLQRHTSYVLSVAFSPDGKTLASGSEDRTVNLWRISDGSLLFSLQGHTDGVDSVTFSPDGTLLASGSYDGTIRLWGLPSPTPASNLITTPTPRIGSTMVSDVDGMVLVYVPAGDFLMGAADDDKDAQTDEKPQHKVYLDAFWIDRTLVTNAMYARCEAAGKCQKPYDSNSYTHRPYYGDPQYDDYPVIYMDWNMATAYCTWAGRRLPAEAEWEKAARGTDGRIYPWGNDINCTKANYAGKVGGNSVYCVGDTTEVGKYPQSASPYGALDMAGNVWEWVNDWYSETYYQNSPYKNPAGPDSGQYHVLRGGSSFYASWYVRASSRTGYLPTSWFTGNIDSGFRCAR